MTKYNVMEVLKDTEGKVVERKIGFTKNSRFDVELLLDSVKTVNPEGVFYVLVGEDGKGDWESI